jgi:hypothetical protein
VDPHLHGIPSWSSDGVAAVMSPPSVRGSCRRPLPAEGRRSTARRAGLSGSPASPQPSVRRYRTGFEVALFGIGFGLSWGWRWRWLLRRDEGLKLCVLGVLLEVGRWPSRRSRRTGRLARFAHRHDRCRKLMWRLGLIPNQIGPFYRKGSCDAP